MFGIWDSDTQDLYDVRHRIKLLIKACDGNSQDGRLSEVRHWASILDSVASRHNLTMLNRKIDLAFNAIQPAREGETERFAEFSDNYVYCCPWCGRTEELGALSSNDIYRCLNCCRTTRMDPDVIATMEGARG